MININLIAERRARKQRETTILRMSMLGVGLVIFIVLALNVSWMTLVGSAEGDLRVAQDKNKELQSQETDYLELKAHVDEQRKLVKLLDQVRVSEEAWMIMLSDISRVIPHEVALSGLATEVENGIVSLRLSGVAKDFDTAGLFMKVLPTTGWAMTPRPNRIQSSENKDAKGPAADRYTFEIKVPVQGLYGGEL